MLGVYHLTDEVTVTLVVSATALVGEEAVARLLAYSTCLLACRHSVKLASERASERISDILLLAPSLQAHERTKRMLP